ncbi:hypothetical protein CXB51_036666 [Gossypium anomalum]|uniref:Uncharacterized protein n=1 Tax=Gossypium anomalum TaxID=47600 RepID=A0A8J5XYT5_9ROSI|nr:hypothetical protein CXB51_036666 [Gossypium anomalum]
MNKENIAKQAMIICYRDGRHREPGQVGTASVSPPQPQRPPPLALPSTPPAKTRSSSHPPHKCPTAETFYRSPAPGELPFAKVNACSILAIKPLHQLYCSYKVSLIHASVSWKSCWWWWWPKDWSPKRWRSRCRLSPRGQHRGNGGAVPIANLCAGIRIIETSTFKTDKLTRAVIWVLAWLIAVGDSI